MEKQIRIIICGKVQGVFYRVSTAKTAKKLRLTGWVKNRSDGCVEVLAQGFQEKLEQLLDWVKDGPPSAQVADVEVQWQDKSGQFEDFKIKI